MEYLVLGFFTGLSLILAVGAQNIFVIEQGLKKQHIFLVCLVCSFSDLILIFLGIFLFHYFIQYFNSTIELIFNLLLIIFLIHFIYSKIKSYNSKVNFNNEIKDISKFNIFLKTLGFTYLNPHVYSDCIFFILFFIGYLSKYLSKYAQDEKIWKIINIFIICFMSLLTVYVILETVN